MTLTRTQVRALLDDHGLTPSRALGQNFVVEANTLRQIVRLAGVREGDRVVEIGAGLGCLSLALAEAGARVTAVEIDQHLLPVLREVVADVAVDVLAGDAMSLDWPALLDGLAETDGPGPFPLVANLPYNVATPLLLDLLDGVPQLDPMLVMVQKEVGERLAASAGTSAYGIPSVKVAYWGRAEVVAAVPAAVFHPRPNVDSVLVRVERHPGGPATDADPEVLFSLVRAGFGQRRKMLRRSLSGLVASDVFAAADVDPEARAESLDIAAWSRLTHALGA